MIVVVQRTVYPILIQRFNNCSSSNNNNNLTSFNVCHQIGRSNSASRQLESGTSLFQSFVVECRQPFYDVICGTSDQQAASKQLYTFLVANFEQAKVVFLSGGKYVVWIYQWNFPPNIIIGFFEKTFFFE